MYYEERHIEQPIEKESFVSSANIWLKTSFPLEEQERTQIFQQKASTLSQILQSNYEDMDGDNTYVSQLFNIREPVYSNHSNLVIIYNSSVVLSSCS